MDFDPFKDRASMPDATSDCDIFMHFLKAVLGTGILSLPIAFKYVGLYWGLILTALTALICGHCAYVLVKCAHRLYYLEKVTKMSYAEVLVKSFNRGPRCVKAMTTCARRFCNFMMFVTYFGSCSVYVVITAKNFVQVLEHWTGETYNLRIIIICIFFPIIVLIYIPNLKKLAPVSIFANFLMACSLGITVYYLLAERKDINSRDLFILYEGLPQFFAIVIFAMECIGVIMPMENSMRTPTHFLGVCGLMSQGMIIVAILCSFIGFFGYLRYGPDTAESITLNLPVEEEAAQLVKLLIAGAVFCTTGLQFTVCREIAWDYFGSAFQNRPKFGDYLLRTIITISFVALAVAVPTIAPFMGLIGAFCFSILGLIMPVVCEMILNLETGFGTCGWILIKDVLIIIFGIFALIFGTMMSLIDISKIYS